MTARGKILFTLIFLALVGFGIKKWWPQLQPGGTPTSAQSSGEAAAGSDIKLAETQFEVPKLAPPATYAPKDNIVDIELSEYAGYAGLIAANGGLEPNDDSIFAKKHGFKVRLKLSEEESWSALNSGKMAASATTVDVLATYGKQFQVVVPAQIGFSRGADGVVVRSEIKRINDLKGQVLVAPEFTEGDFFIRYLAQEAGLGINMLADLKAKPDPDKLNLVFTEEGPAAGDVFAADLQGGHRLAGCVTWAPKTNEVADGSGGKARVLTTNTNLLVIADILIVNKGFAQAQPKMVAGLVEGLIEGNRMVRENPDPQLDTIGRAFKWDRAKTKAELAKVHLANGPENLAFINGAIDAAGSFAGIYQSAVLAYGSDLIKNPLDASHFIDAQYLKALDTGGAFAGQQIAIQPIKSGGGGPVEGDPLLSKNIRFTFEPNSSKLDVNNQANLKSLTDLRKLLEISPGSRILLRGHVDNSKVEEFRKQGGDSYVRDMALRAMQLSKERASEIARQLVEHEKVDPARLDTVGRGWEEPLGKNMDENRRVEAQWMTLE